MHPLSPFLSHNTHLLNIALAELVVAMYGPGPASHGEAEADDATAKRRNEIETSESLVDDPVVCEDCHEPGPPATSLSSGHSS